MVLLMLGRLLVPLDGMYGCQKKLRWIERLIRDLRGVRTMFLFGFLALFGTITNYFTLPEVITLTKNHGLTMLIVPSPHIQRD